MPKFCHSCGAALVDRAAFCSECGTVVKVDQSPVAQSPLHSAVRQVFTPVRPEEKSNRNWGRTLVSYVLFGVVVLVLLAIWSSPSDHNPTAPGVVRTDENLAPVAAPTPMKRGIGEDVSVGYWLYRCNGARWQSFIGGLGETVEAPDAQFLVLDMYVRNNDRSASLLPPLKLVDAQGREYDESSKGTFMPGAFDMLKQLNPTVSSRGYAIFDVPHGQYALLVSGGFESGEHALIDLSATTLSASASGQPSSAAAQPSSAPQPAGDYGALPVQTVTAQLPDKGTEASRPASSPSATTQTAPSPHLRFESGVRLFIHLISIERQPDGNFTFRGTLLLPLARLGDVPLEQGTILAGSGTVDSANSGRFTVSVREFVVGGAKYAPQSTGGLNAQSGTGPGIGTVEVGQTLEMWFSSASVYQKPIGLDATADQQQ
jgi:hypothetical protein